VGNKDSINDNGIARLNIRYPVLWLVLAAFIVYFPSFFYGVTELDDFILILHSDKYNEHISSIFSAFHRGVFEIANGHFYRPVFIDSIILNYQLCGKHIAGYHIVNVGFHMIAVALLYKLYLRLNIKAMYAFILCLLFAVHPVLSQAVAWIPGRNDALLGIFAISFFLYTINYTQTGKVKDLLLSCFFLLLTCFTKESGVFAPPAAFVILVFILHEKWLSNRNITQYMLWTGCLIVWVLMRASAHQKGIQGPPIVVLKEFVYRMPVILQYLGKIFFPFNLSVYPALKQTTNIYGIIAFALMCVVLYLNKERSWRIVWGGVGIFLLFLVPVLLLPSAMSLQTYEQRLYVPLMGILIMLPQTSLINNRLKDRQLLCCYIGVACILAGINFYHQRNFANPYTFWKQATVSSPASAHAFMVLAKGEPDSAKSYLLFQKAYAINPREKFLNYCRGVKLQNEDSVLASEPYLLEEKKISGYYECDFYLSRVAVKKNDMAAALAYLQNYLVREPDNLDHAKNKVLDNPAWQNAATARNYALHLPHPGIALGILDVLGVQ